MHRGAPQADQQKQDRYHQQSVNLALAELRIGGHGRLLHLAELIRVKVIEKAEA
jgi:hypothetical protein